MNAFKYQDFLIASKLREIREGKRVSTFCRHLPRRIVIEATSRCNLNCLFCARSDPKMFSHGRGDLSTALLEKILKPLKIKTIGIGGLGEPLLHPEIEKIVLLAKRSAQRVTLSTNGTLLGEKAELLADLPLAAIFVSIDGGDNQTHQKIRGYPLGKLLESVKAFAEHTRVPIVAYAVLSGLNNQSLLKLPKLLADKKIPNLAGINYQLYNPLNSQADPQYIFDPSRLQDWSKEMEKEGKKYGFSLTDTSDFPDEQSRVCMSPFLMPAINHRGFLTPCCRRYSQELGDCGSLGFSQAWNSGKIRSFRNRVLQRDYPQECSRICNSSLNL